MYIQDLKIGGHDWKKQNLSEQNGRVYQYDIMECSQCKMKGQVKKDSDLIEISERHRLMNVQKCPKE
jgi:hypothetical protein